MSWNDFISGECSVYCSCLEERNMLYDMCKGEEIDAHARGIHGSGSFRVSNICGQKILKIVDGVPEEDQWHVKYGYTKYQVAFRDLVNGEQPEFNEKEFLQMLEECGL